MDTVTYPESLVVDFIQKNLIPLRIQFDTQPFATNFNITWTPTLVTLDTEGKEHFRTTGFLAPGELIPSLLLGIAKCHFDQEQFTKALATLKTLLQDYPKSDASPEAIFLQGVALYKSTHDAQPLKEAYETLQAEYPTSEWAKRAYPYRLL